MKCPTCKRETEYDNNPFRPFCSERCKLIDLGDWLRERHRVPTSEKPPEIVHGPNGNRHDEE
jgi:hypothetical protein